MDKILFMGTPDMAVPSLKKLVEAGEKIVGVVTQPNRPTGRGRSIQPCAVAKFSKEKGIPLLQPENVKEESFLKKLGELSPDLIVVVAFGQILPKTILDLPPQKCINLHFSLLPKYRGAAPVQWALINNDEITGVSTLYITQKLDAGDVLFQKKYPIETEDTAATLSSRLSIAGADLLLETIDKLKRNDLQPTPQDKNEVVLAPSLKKEDGRIDFSKSAHEIFGQIRGMNPWPGTFTKIEGKHLKIHRAEVAPKKMVPGTVPGTILAIRSQGIEVACGKEALLVTEVQLEGKKRMSVSNFLKGFPLNVGVKLG